MAKSKLVQQFEKCFDISKCGAITFAYTISPNCDDRAVLARNNSGGEIFAYGIGALSSNERYKLVKILPDHRPAYNASKEYHLKALDNFHGQEIDLEPHHIHFKFEKIIHFDVDMIVVSQRSGIKKLSYKYTRRVYDTKRDEWIQYKFYKYKTKINIVSEHVTITDKPSTFLTEGDIARIIMAAEMNHSLRLRERVNSSFQVSPKTSSKRVTTSVHGSKKARTRARSPPSVRARSPRHAHPRSFPDRSRYARSRSPPSAHARSSRSHYRPTYNYTEERKYGYTGRSGTSSHSS